MRWGCRVIDPLEAGGTRDLHDLLALGEAQATLTGWNLSAAVEAHVPRLSRDAQTAWQRLQTLLRA